MQKSANKAYFTSNTNLKNMWTQEALNNAPYYYNNQEQDIVKAFNLNKNANHVIHPNLFPEPFIGNPLAPVILLSLNPGYSPEDVQLHQQPNFAQASRKNLLHDFAHNQYPFFLLDPQFRNAPGYTWWSQRLGLLIRATSRETVAQKVCVVEWFGYHSQNFRRIPNRMLRNKEINHPQSILPHQVYSFGLVKAAIERNATIIMMRSEKLWLETMPELNGHYTMVKNVQQPYISPKNLPLDAFNEIVNRLQ